VGTNAGPANLREGANQTTNLEENILGYNRYFLVLSSRSSCWKLGCVWVCLLNMRDIVPTKCITVIAGKVYGSEIEASHIFHVDTRVMI
jgi:hypothetical protein